MRDAGHYPEVFVWMVRTLTKNITNGQDVETFPDSSALWGSIELGTGTEGVEYGTPQAQSNATVRLRQWPAIKNVDRIRHKRTGLVYVITGRQTDYRANETVLQVTLYDDLELIDQ